MDALLRDIRHSIRNLVRAPAFTTVAVVLMALGIGATTTLFNLTYGVLLKPLPWPAPDRVVRLQETRGGSPGRIPWTISNTTYHAWREQPSAIDDVGGWMRSQTMTLAVGPDAAERVRVGKVTPSLLRVLGVPPGAGRVFADEDASNRGGPTVVVIGFDFWQRRLGGDPAAIGRSLRLDDRLVTVVGVMPPGFAFPDRETEAWLPLDIPRVWAGADVIQAMIFNAAARLRPGVTPQQAASEATARGLAAPRLGSGAVALFGNDGAVAVAAVPARDALTADVRPALVVLLAAVALIFSTAIASVLVLQASRALKRRREMAIRMAIGAGAGRLARLWLVESAIIGLAGGVAGLLAAGALHRILPAVLPPDFPRLGEVRMGALAGSVAGGLTLLAVAVCGLVPMLQLRDRALASSLNADAVSDAAGAATTRATRIRRGMMVGQVAIACVLLVGTGLLVRSFAALLSADRGFDPHGVLTAHFTTAARAFASASAGLERAQQRLSSLAGVTDVAFGNALPFVTTGGFRGFRMPSPADPGTTVQVQTIMRTVSPEYFAAMRLRLVAGRALEAADTASSLPVVVVNRTFASRYLGSHPLGAILPVAAGTRRAWTVVGVVDDLRQGGLNGVAPSAFGGVPDSAAAGAVLHVSAIDQHRAGDRLRRPQPGRCRVARADAADDRRRGRTVARGRFDHDARRPGEAEPRAATDVRDAPGGIRRLRAVDCRRRPLRRDVVPGRAADARNRDPRGARRDAGRHPAARLDGSRRDPRRRRLDRPRRGVPARAHAHAARLRDLHPRRRQLRRRPDHSERGRRGRVRRAGVPRDAREPAGGAAPRLAGGRRCAIRAFTIFRTRATGSGWPGVKRIVPLLVSNAFSSSANDSTTAPGYKAQ